MAALSFPLPYVFRPYLIWNTTLNVGGAAIFVAIFFAMDPLLPNVKQTNNQSTNLSCAPITRCWEPLCASLDTLCDLYVLDIFSNTTNNNATNNNVVIYNLYLNKDTSTNQ